MSLARPRPASRASRSNPTCPVTFGILTTDTTEQALERAGVKGGNKGADAMLAAIEMVQLVRQIDRQLPLERAPTPRLQVR